MEKFIPYVSKRAVRLTHQAVDHVWADTWVLWQQERNVYLQPTVTSWEEWDTWIHSFILHRRKWQQQVQSQDTLQIRRK